MLLIEHMGSHRILVTGESPIIIIGDIAARQSWVRRSIVELHARWRCLMELLATREGGKGEDVLQIGIAFAVRLPGLEEIPHRRIVRLVATNTTVTRAGTTCQNW
jgi:hypothetical protein